MMYILNFSMALNRIIQDESAKNQTAHQDYQIFHFRSILVAAQIKLK